MKHDRSARICVIGAGASGITAAKNLLQVGLRNIVVYEKNEVVGGNWVYSPRLTHSSVYETTHTISSKALSQYDDWQRQAWAGALVLLAVVMLLNIGIRLVAGQRVVAAARAD